MRKNTDPDTSSPNLSREERLAAKLRENLRRRKAQARQMDDQAPDIPTKTPDSPTEKPDTLSKEEPKG